MRSMRRKCIDMALKCFIGVFETEAQILAAVRAARSAGYEIVDCFTPYAVHGLDSAMGVRHTKLGWVALAAGFLGFGTAVGLQVWTSAFNWPINVGGKPMVSAPAFVPVTFELTVLFCGLITVAALFLRCWLKPFSDPPGLAQYRGTNDRFVLALGTKSNYSETEMSQFMVQQGAIESKWHEEA